MSREADIERMNVAGRTLFKTLAEGMRKAGKPCDLDDYAVRAEWSHLRSRSMPERQYQMYLDATFSLDGTDGGTQLISTALVASGRTMVECLETFHNWAIDAAADPDVLVVFRDKAIRGEQGARDDAKDAAERDADAEAARAKAKGVRERTQQWLAKKLDFKLRKDGMAPGKIQV